MLMSKTLAVGQKIRNKRTGLVRVITKVSNDSVSYTKDDGKKGKCSVLAIQRWISGNDQ